MSTVKFVSKKPAGPLGNYNYEYKCACADGTAKANVIVSAANDNGALALAQLECDANCGEALSGEPAQRQD